jgi:hypothetical protein
VDAMSKSTSNASTASLDSSSHSNPVLESSSTRNVFAPALVEKVGGR